MAGTNRAAHTFGSSKSTAKHCVFLSHARLDVSAAESIGNEFLKYGIDTYLDKNDRILQDAVKKEDAEKVTLQIQDGIEKSTHILCILSDKTKKSWWVPYEIGYGKKSQKPLSILSLIDVHTLPAYLQVIPNIGGISQLEQFIRKLGGSLTFNESIAKAATNTLSKYMKP